MIDVLTPKLLHQLRGHAGIEWCQREVNVIVHEHVGVKKATRVQQRIAEQMQITLPVGVIEKAGEAIVTPLHDVLRNAGQIESRKSGHESNVATHPSYWSHRGCADRISLRHAVAPEVNVPPFFKANQAMSGPIEIWLNHGAWGKPASTTR
ncbi:hypothetical protein [Burkholderia cepacia]|uniref:hypothetical protein n=1 Tax=Burkholderia cepacia TaxID=292 RepID=UPI0021C69135|nr:hypothetical protein [Burkholderia cepacia]